VLVGVRVAVEVIVGVGDDAVLQPTTPNRISRLIRVSRKLAEVRAMETPFIG